MIEIVRAKEHHEEELGNLWMEFMRFSQDIDPVQAPRDGAVPVFIKDYLRPAMSDEGNAQSWLLPLCSLVPFGNSLRESFG